MSLTLQKTIEYMKSQCNYFVNGSCDTRKCTILNPADPNMSKDPAICEYRMAVHYLEQAEKARDQVTERSH